MKTLVVEPDITEHKLAEKETLLRELYHRTRNNMQVIIALLSFQAEVHKNELVSRVVDETSSRIMSMSLVHQKLYQSQNLSSINLQDYVDELLNSLLIERDLPKNKIKLIVSVEPIIVMIDTAVPLGLLFHEIISNAFKHAFPKNTRGEVNIKIKQDANGVIDIKISDNGIGVPENFNFYKNNTLGLQIIFEIVEKQLRGKVSFINQRGLTCNVQFKNYYNISRV